MLTKGQYKELITGIVQMHPGITETRLRIKVLEHVGPTMHDYVNYQIAVEELILENNLVSLMFRLNTNLTVTIHFPKDTVQVHG